MRHAPAAVLALALGACELRAQQAGTAVLRVRVTDSTGTPIVGADVSVMRGLRETVAATRSDDSGRALLQFSFATRDTLEYHLLTRKIGYNRVDQFFVASARDSMTFAVKLWRPVQQLATVKVSEREELRRRAYFIDAEAIASASRPIYSGLEVIERLRPDMIYGLGGHGVCPKISQVFVNGRRIKDAPSDAIDRAAFRAPNQLVPGTRHAVAYTTKVTGMPAAILMSIRPEHIAEIRYNDCFETQIKVNMGANAAFVVLKPGVGYSEDIGSYVLEDPVASARAIEAARVRAQRRPARAAPPESAAEVLPSYRARLLGVFDDETGAPIDSAAVIDAASGTRMLTSATGTVALVFVPDGGGELRIEKPGYKPLTLTVTISPRDTVPLTLTLSRRR